MNDVTEMIKQAEIEVQEREAASGAADSRAAAAQADAVVERERLKEARIVLDWLRRRSQPVAASPGQRAGQSQSQPATRFGRPVPEVALTDKCRDALEALGGTATNKQLVDHLRRNGHETDLDKVRASLRYLSRKKPPSVQTDPGSGLWRLVSPSTSFTPAADAAGVSAAGENGHSSQSNVLTRADPFSPPAR